MDTYKQGLLHRAKIVRGHMDKVISMIEKDEYCLDIIQQSYAVQSALRKIEELVLERHLKTCVRDSITKNKDIDEKVSEVVELFRKK